MAWEAGSWDECDGSWDGMAKVGAGRYSLATFLILPRSIFTALTTLLTHSQPFSAYRNLFTSLATFFRLPRNLFPAYRNLFHTTSEPIPSLGIFPTFRLHSRFSELIHSFGLIQIRFTYMLASDSHFGRSL